MGVALLVVLAATVGFGAGVLGRPSAATDRLLTAALRALDAAERDVAHWRQIARYWERCAEDAASGADDDVPG